MVCIRECGHCSNGDHTICIGKDLPPKRPNGEMVFGGFICSCCGNCTKKERRYKEKSAKGLIKTVPIREMTIKEFEEHFIKKGR